MPGFSQLVIATHNPGKVVEYRDLLKDLPIELLSLGDVGIETDVEETGDTFEENAWLKADTYSQLSGLLTLSDDSGLEVEALGREPGIYTARYGGERCTTFQERVQLLLHNLATVPLGKAHRPVQVRHCPRWSPGEDWLCGRVGSRNDRIPTGGYAGVRLRPCFFPPVLRADHGPALPG